MAAKYTVKQFIDAIQGSKGVISVIAQRVGCDRSTVYKYKNDSPTVAQAIEDERESMKDYAEGALFKMIASGNTTALIFYLKTQARDRGYVERQEFDHTSKGEQISPSIFLPAVSNDSTDDAGD